MADYAGPGPHKFYLLQSNVKKRNKKKNSMIAGAASFLFSCIMYTSQFLLSLPLNSACGIPVMQAEFDVQNLKGLCDRGVSTGQGGWPCAQAPTGKVRGCHLSAHSSLTNLAWMNLPEAPGLS